MSEQGVKGHRDEEIVHVPPTPEQATKFIVAAMMLFFVASCFGGCFALSSNGNPLGTASWIFTGMGSITGLLAWHAFGNRAYQSRPRGQVLPARSAPASGARYALVKNEALPHGAIVENPSGQGTEEGEGYLVCRRYDEASRWWRPTMLLQYGATAAFIWSVTAGQRSERACLILPAAWVAMPVCFFWLMIDSPWCVIDVGAEGCFLDINAGPHGVGAYRLRILRAVQDGADLVLTMEDDVTKRVAFPGGSLAPEIQQAIALDLFRHRGIPTTVDDRPLTGAPYR
jgi:hypothetical protein